MSITRARDMDLMNNISDHATGSSIYLERGGGSIGPCPRTIEAKIGSASRGKHAIVGHIRHRNIAPGLSVASVPELSDRLTIGKAPGQSPSVQGCAPGIVDRYTGPKASRPLAGNDVLHRASPPASATC